MKKLFISSIIFCTSVFFLCFLSVEQVSGAETLVVKKNQFEFREEPRVTEETLLGTLRAGSKVTWTGKTSGDWFEVQAPNGQLGWVHKSGLSAPKIRQEPTKKATPKPKSTKPRTVPKPKSDTLEKLAQLEKTNTQYEALLEEKDRRISELSSELEGVEEKLVNMAQLADDTKQLLEKEKVQSAEVQDTLQEALKQKDEELLAEKVEMTKLQNQLTVLQEQTSGGSLQYLSYGLNLLLVILLGAAGLLYVRQKRLDKLAIGADTGDQKNYIISKQYVSSGTPKTNTGQEKAAYKHPGVSKTAKPAIVIPAASPGQEAGIVEEEDIGGEEVIIELSDVLPVQSGEIGEAEELWPTVIEDFENGNLKQVYKSASYPPLKNLVVPKREIFNKRYLFDCIQTSRGCPFNCDFCSTPIMNGRKYRVRPIEEVIEELKTAPAQGTNATRVHRIVRTPFDLHGPVIHLSDLNAATTGTYGTERIDVGKFAGRGYRHPGPILGPDGDIIRELPGKGRCIYTCCSAHEQCNEMSSIYFHCGVPLKIY